MVILAIKFSGLETEIANGQPTRLACHFNGVASNSQRQQLTAALRIIAQPGLNNLGESMPDLQDHNVAMAPACAKLNQSPYLSE